MFAQKNDHDLTATDSGDAFAKPHTRFVYGRYMGGQMFTPETQLNGLPWIAKASSWIRLLHQLPLNGVPDDPLTLCLARYCLCHRLGDTPIED